MRGRGAGAGMTLCYWLFLVSTLRAAPNSHRGACVCTHVVGRCNQVFVFSGEGNLKTEPRVGVGP